MRINKNYKKLFLLLFIISVSLAVFLSPFASSSPDGLEKVAENKNFINKEVKLHGFDLFEDYNFKFIRNEKVSTAFSGFVGIVGVFFMTYLVFKLISKK